MILFWILSLTFYVKRKNSYDETLLAVYRFRACYDRPPGNYELDKCFCLYQMNRALYGTVAESAASNRIKHGILALYNNETNECNTREYYQRHDLDRYFQINSDKMILLYKKTGLVYHVSTYALVNGLLEPANDMFKVKCVDTSEDSQKIYSRYSNKAIDFHINKGYIWYIQKDYCWIYNNNITPLILKIEEYNPADYIPFGIILTMGFVLSGLCISTCICICIISSCLGLTTIGFGVSLFVNGGIIGAGYLKAKKGKQSDSEPGKNPPQVNVVEVEANPVDDYFEENEAPKIEVNRFEL